MGSLATVIFYLPLVAIGGFAGYRLFKASRELHANKRSLLALAIAIGAWVLVVPLQMVGLQSAAPLTFAAGLMLALFVSIWLAIGGLREHREQRARNEALEQAAEVFGSPEKAGSRKKRRAKETATAPPKGRGSAIAALVLSGIMLASL